MSVCAIQNRVCLLHAALMIVHVLLYMPTYVLISFEVNAAICYGCMYNM